MYCNASIQLIINIIDLIQKLVCITDLKIGNNVTQDDIWHPIYVKFEEKVLN
jgi:hypothetical protein